MGNNYHETVMPEEVASGLHIKSGGFYIDATLGTGGHSLAIVKAGGRVLGIEIDPKMLAIAEKRLEAEIGDRDKYKLVGGNFVNIDQIAGKNGWDKVDGIVFDLGVTNLHLTGDGRGFSFSNSDINSNLDMRLDPEKQSIKASDLLNILREDQLRDLFESVLNPGAAKWITGRVVHSRARKPIETVEDFLEICSGLKTGKTGINEATLPFLALRISVNSELDNLKEALPKACGLLVPGGRLAVISFHSGEDSIVKSFFKEEIEKGLVKAVTFKPLVSGEKERQENRSSRSAKLRIIEKI